MIKKINKKKNPSAPSLKTRRGAWPIQLNPMYIS